MNDIDAKGMANDFVEEKENNKNYVVVVLILYILVIILSTILVLGLKDQKQTIENSKTNQVEINK